MNSFFRTDINEGKRKKLRFGYGMLWTVFLGISVLFAVSAASAQDDERAAAPRARRVRVAEATRPEPEELAAGVEQTGGEEPDQPSDGAPGETGLPDYDDLVRRLQRAESQISELKGGARTVNNENYANEAGEPTGSATSPRDLLNELFSSGAISRPDFADIEGASKLRNQIVHGFTPSGDPCRSREYLVKMTQQLIKDSNELIAL